MKEKKLWQCKVVCENLEVARKELKYKKGEDHYYARQIVATTVVSTQNNSSM
jgi:ribosomal 30S subunit maturation factor RimM